ncbi:hypothetical protein L1987_50678 [Smallanthus sonchifolius]|uniref:Uncharacterized protein n=1 Tax=Smallanthus sonchifolius TaxID=185202 RepID=A0ACB9ENI3_9ASTR|nr:hypothetical protein L1987_50678 [Smallanthus sonchifolius]
MFHPLSLPILPPDANRRLAKPVTALSIPLLGRFSFPLDFLLYTGGFMDLCNFMNFSKNIRCLKCKTEEMMLKLRKEIEIAHEDEVHMYCNDNREMDTAYEYCNHKKDVNQLLYVVYGLL